MSPRSALQRTVAISAAAVLALSACVAPRPAAPVVAARPPTPPASVPKPRPPDYVVDGRRMGREAAEQAFVDGQLRTQWPRNLDARPSILQARLPDYPAAALRACAQGLVRVKFHIDVEGAVDDVRLLLSSGTTREHRLLDLQVVDVMRTWRFSPITRAGLPQDLWMAFEYRFVCD